MSAINLNNERVLVGRIAEGDEQAFREVYDAYRNKIFSYAFGLTETDDEANEIVQEVFLKVWVNRDKLAEVEHFNAWIYRIAKNLFLDALKKKAKQETYKKHLRLVKDELTNETDDFILNRENEVLLNSMTEDLPAQQKLIFKLRTEGYKLDEIADQLNISKNTVKVHLNRALTTLKARLGNQNDKAVVLLLILISTSRDIF